MELLCCKAAPTNSQIRNRVEKQRGYSMYIPLFLRFKKLLKSYIKLNLTEYQR